VHRPVRTPHLVLEMFRYHRRFSHARKNPIWTGIAPPYRCVRTGRLRETGRSDHRMAR
jgi:hypothetical protein